MPAACDTALNIFAVVPKIKSKNGFCFAPFMHFLIHCGTLIGRNHKIRYGAVARGHICEEPSELNAMIDKPIHIFIRRKQVGVFACVAKRSAERNASVFKPFHSCGALFKCALAAAEIVFLFIAFN